MEASQRAGHEARRDPADAQITSEALVAVEANSHFLAQEKYRVLAGTDILWVIYTRKCRFDQLGVEADGN
jgi:hypothetical protein